ncbi:MAG: TetR/AcrR family transcriptional regulator [Gemmatimonadales bacterium]
MKESIATAAAVVLLRDGLQKWSVDRVAAEAGCAKGLVPYHHGSKQQLLSVVAANLHRDKTARRLAALDASGAEALDRLWDAINLEVRSGEWAAWAALMAEPNISLPPQVPSHLPTLAAAIGRALGIPALRPDEARLAEASLDGFQAALHLGAPAESVHEAYHRLWLALLP